jgi:LuxR family maltose regulon positive regulatory protein
VEQGCARDRARHLLASLSQTVGTAPLQWGLVDPLSARSSTCFGCSERPERTGYRRRAHGVSELHAAHTKSIFTKLGVNNRRAAVRRAEELGL